MFKVPVRDVPDVGLDWEQRGCQEYRKFWGGGVTKEPRFLGENDSRGERYYRCAICGAFWSYGWGNPVEISIDKAQEYLPDLRQLLIDNGFAA
ncbi:hypothetical protein [Leucobacter denitrificans]|uniref:Uncharacterized protein n=1 Tax=Leucobacter denitrificans TaxID=683042 RepID=A0A7G9S4E3_9MICO|nr:hypothetical protein [Leucobacter denitrificans]QNN62718.1 hypothetical protein H9L06_10930 [Leucobacter denitrificans]